jgi:hypothetical protein
MKWPALAVTMLAVATAMKCAGWLGVMCAGVITRYVCHTPG